MNGKKMNGKKMNVIVFKELLHLVEDKFGLEMVDILISQST